ncbi:hypothetical protein SLEP1_g2583 [Rubroshorea leprosula]|uniref:Uncharacterized protein n=1 Tax=Rubroshorea leprosula TaxID=152421 RepID=A0AAV5HTF1_9ROSI|nr:hypothetical protein SLEP1_g2583 [Rubroshorea leprosula]
MQDSFGDLPRTITPESSASSSTGGGSSDRRSSTSSSDLSAEETPSEERGVEKGGYGAPAIRTEAEAVVFEGWESKVINGRLDNLRKAPKTLPAGFRFRAALHHEVADGAALVKGFKKLEEMRLGVPTKAVVFRSLFLCCLCPSTSGTRWYYISRREKMMIFTNIRNKVAGWKRQFIFVRDTRIERINNELAARLSEWRTLNASMNYPQLTVGDVNLKNQLLDHVKARGLVDLKALVTPEQLALLGFVDMTNLHAKGIFLYHTRISSRSESYAFVCAREMSSILERQRQRAQGSRNRGAGFGSQRQTRFDERPPAAPGRSSSHRSLSSTPRQRTEQRVEIAPSHSRRRAREDSNAEDDIPLIRRRTSMGSQLALATIARPAMCPRHKHAVMVKGMQSFVPPADRQRAKGHVQQHGGHAALLKLMDAFSYPVALFECEQGAREMANRATSAESRADELARKVNKLREELEKAWVKKENGIQAAKEEADRAEDRAKKVESDREKALHELNSLKERVVEADLHVARVEVSLEQSKRYHQRDICFARAQGAEWLVGADMFQDAVAVASANTTTDIFNEIRGKVLRHGADFSIYELAFFGGEEIDEEGKSLAPLPDTWVAEPREVPVEPSSTPPSSQPAPAAAPALSPPDRSSHTRSIAAHTNASIPVDLTDD